MKLSKNTLNHGDFAEHPFARSASSKTNTQNAAPYPQQNHFCQHTSQPITESPSLPAACCFPVAWKAPLQWRECGGNWMAGSRVSKPARSLLFSGCLESALSMAGRRGNRVHKKAGRRATHHLLFSDCLESACPMAGRSERQMAGKRVSRLLLFSGCAESAFSMAGKPAPANSFPDNLVFACS